VWRLAQEKLALEAALEREDDRIYKPSRRVHSLVEQANAIQRGRITPTQLRHQFYLGDERVITKTETHSDTPLTTELSGRNGIVDYYNWHKGKGNPDFEAVISIQSGLNNKFKQVFQKAPQIPPYMGELMPPAEPETKLEDLLGPVKALNGPFNPDDDKQNPKRPGASNTFAAPAPHFGEAGQAAAQAEVNDNANLAAPLPGGQEANARRPEPEAPAPAPGVFQRVGQVAANIGRRVYGAFNPGMDIDRRIRLMRGEADPEEDPDDDDADYFETVPRANVTGSNYVPAYKAETVHNVDPGPHLPGRTNLDEDLQVAAVPRPSRRLDARARQVAAAAQERAVALAVAAGASAEGARQSGLNAMRQALAAVGRGAQAVRRNLAVAGGGLIQVLDEFGGASGETAMSLSAAPGVAYRTVAGMVQRANAQQRQIENQAPAPAIVNPGRPAAAAAGGPRPPQQLALPAPAPAAQLALPAPEPGQGAALAQAAPPQGAPAAGAQQHWEAQAEAAAAARPQRVRVQPQLLNAGLPNLVPAPPGINMVRLAEMYELLENRAFPAQLPMTPTDAGAEGSAFLRNGRFRDQGLRNWWTSNLRNGNFIRIRDDVDNRHNALLKEQGKPGNYTTVGHGKPHGKRSRSKSSTDGEMSDSESVGEKKGKKTSRSRFVKGSQEAKDFMASLRAKRRAKGGV